MPLSDTELVKRAQNNSMSAFKELMERYKRKVYFTALGVVKTHQDAEDILQETMLQALRSIGNLKQTSGFVSWILRIAYNRSIDLIRKRKREVYTTDDEETGLNLFDLLETQDGASDPHRGMSNKQLVRAIVNVLDSLPETQREAFRLKHISQLSIKEIAAATDSSESTVKTNIFRAVQKMRRELGDFYEKQPGNKNSKEARAFAG
jgi:RNA polymerase sigma-70 factor (ECF subfamily)